MEPRTGLTKNEMRVWVPIKIAAVTVALLTLIAVWCYTPGKLGIDLLGGIACYGVVLAFRYFTSSEAAYIPMAIGYAGMLLMFGLLLHAHVYAIYGSSYAISMVTLAPGPLRLKWASKPVTRPWEE